MGQTFGSQAQLNIPGDFFQYLILSRLFAGRTFPKKGQTCVVHYTGRLPSLLESALCIQQRGLARIPLSHLSQQELRVEPASS